MSGHYVYTLVDPRSGEVFYVGKGSGKRAWIHVKQARAGNGNNPRKCRRILEIEAAGHEVVVVITSTHDTHAAALAAESKLIAWHGRKHLTNELPGEAGNPDADDEAAFLHAHALLISDFDLSTPRARAAIDAARFVFDEMRYKFGLSKADALITAWWINEAPALLDGHARSPE